MFDSKMRIVLTVMALSILPVGVGAGVATAREAHVFVPIPIFFPQADFRYDDGYYRYHTGHYYHYDRDRDGWHYGRNHDEGMRYEKRHGGHR